MRRTLSEAAAASGGTLAGADGPFAAVSTDSRSIGRGDLFVALKGPNFDGHEFVDAAARAGAAGAMLDRPSPVSLPQIIVSDTLAGLTALARSWRDQFDIPVVGVAGSNGKTTVKEMIAAIFARCGSCLSTRGNLNNHIGVPLTLMRLEPGHRIAVIEIGANRGGEVAQLAALARPRVGLITNAGEEHLEGFGNLDGVARGEGEMVASLPADGVAVINADDVYASLWRQMSTAQRIVTFGMSEAADFRATDWSQTIANGRFALRFTLHARFADALIPIELQLAGRHNVHNALAAAAAAHAAGSDLADITAGLRSVSAVNGRLQLKAARGGAWLIDDTYNANPGSVLAALEVLADLPGRKYMVLGDMAELGEFAQESHAQAGELARRYGVDRLFAAGSLSTHAAQAFGAGGEWFEDVQALIRRVEGELAPDITVLVKGSRVSRMERVVQALVPKAH